MKDTPKKKISKEEHLDNNITKLLFILNNPETKCNFWKIDNPDAHIMGIRSINRTTIEVINENGFNPYESKIEEKLFRCFKIYVLDENDDNIINKEEIEKRKEIEKDGIVYIKNADLIWIIEKVRKSS